MKMPCGQREARRLSPGRPPRGLGCSPVSREPSSCVSIAVCVTVTISTSPALLRVNTSPPLTPAALRTPSSVSWTSLWSLSHHHPRALPYQGYISWLEASCEHTAQGRAEMITDLLIHFFFLLPTETSGLDTHVQLAIWLVCKLMSQDCLPRGPFKSSWLCSACARMVLSFFQDFFQVPGASAATADPVRPSAQRLRFCDVSLGCSNRVLHLGGRKHQKHVVSSSAGREFHIKVLAGGPALCPEAPGEGPSLHPWACGCILPTSASAS